MAKYNKGFTLIEIMVSILMLALISGTVLGFFSQHLNLALRNENRLRAANVARQTMEGLYWQQGLNTAVNTPVNIPAGAMGMARNPVSFSSVADGSGATPRYRVITTVVRWQ